MEVIIHSTAIVTAAGSGQRMGGDIKKQFRELDGIPILIRTLSPFFSSALISNIIVTAPEEDLEYCENLILQYFEPIPKPFLVIAGGLERQDSVFGALQQCPKDTDLVFVHDAVRPFISLDLIEELHQIACREKAVVPAARLKNTIKQITGEYISQSLVRDRLVQVFTPQVFQYKLLRDSYVKAYNDGYISTDDAALVEHYGAKVRYHLTSDLNIKITDEWDLTLAHLIIEKNILI
ncbi:MAG: 2-C-methyl-D-erythritol 4-phosphate cytidylyltransferase [Candidatus Cloacimonadaceae bacterium]|nr:2-C-methyl-D-erythritol 4-phosphate cytidylyltransferase [Candidatus Cloacimonadota bacterium]MDY0127905.1 2-C-methyl-D-erythritol 4-phosphate cytidylyltransferase [Candidatus Cloacimonadaceae bacterium]MCB5255792.1 2-C-methyl-D-erythritol 4-phosphate cytidylyltransferase [Candidatus Cloacimonadota bacterium]MCK9178313.1 2-C-methyl-D-erythritol 4-phosphate cytidylyltransferase [Candidatus Cloacimonadota bacterium]MCK9242943.1 2-C-methyl-D-erythritol 4-phosphate cytidylyltransferase [Candidat